MGSASPPLSGDYFREVLGQYPTGVVAVTACDGDGDPVGMVFGSFGSVSLDPPLVSFMPGKYSATWARLGACETYCVNVLGAEQENVCRSLASKRADKFDDIAWVKSANGAPLIAGSIANIECVKEQVHEAGDHLIVICRVRSLAVGNPGTPLLFYRGGYGTFSSQTLVSGDLIIVEKIKLLDRIRDRLDRLAAEFDTEIAVVALVDDELVVLGSYGKSLAVGFPSRVGLRMPFVPPVGGIFAAWGTPVERAKWVAYSAEGQPEAGKKYEDAIDRILRRGYALGLGHEASRSWAREAYFSTSGKSDVGAHELRRMTAELEGFNPGELADDTRHEFHFASVPVFDRAGHVALGIVLWGPEEKVSLDSVTEISQRLVEVAGECTEAIGGRVPPAMEDPP